MVVAGGIDDQLAEEFSGGGGDHPDVEIVDEKDDVGSGVGSSDADVVEPAADPQGDDAGVVDAVVPDPCVGVAVATAGRPRLGPVAVGRGGGGAVRQRPVGAVVVAGVDEAVDEGLQVGDGGGLIGLRAQPFLHRLLEPFDLAAGGGVVGRGVLLGHVQAAQFAFEGVAAAAAAGRPGGEHHAVVGQCGGGHAVGGHRAAEGVAHDRAGDAGPGADVQGVA